MDLYQAPSSDTNGEESSFRELVVGWEKRRLNYNLILLLPGLLTLVAWTYRDFSQMVLILPGALFFALGANLCYFLGPLAELYGKAVFRNFEVRNLCYWSGVILSLVIIFGFGALGLFISAVGWAD